MNQKVVEEIKEIIRREDILRHIQKMDAYYHHGKVTTMWHCIAVTYFSLKIASLLKLKIQKKTWLSEPCFMTIICMIGMYARSIISFMDLNMQGLH